MTINKDIAVMVSEPGADLTIEMAKELYEEIKDEQELANLYSIVCNKAWWMADNEFDYEEGTEQYIEARRITEQWFALEEKLKESIWEVLRNEGVRIPKKRQIIVLEPFMQRYGFQNASGWWIQKRDF